MSPSPTSKRSSTSCSAPSSRELSTASTTLPFVYSYETSFWIVWRRDDSQIRFCFVIINQTAECHRFQATSESEMRTWLAIIQNAIGTALNAQPLLSRLSRSSVASLDGDDSPRPGGGGGSFGGPIGSSSSTSAQTASSNVRLSRKRSLERQQRATMRLEALLAAPGNSIKSGTRFLSLPSGHHYLGGIPYLFPGIDREPPYRF